MFSRPLTLSGAGSILVETPFPLCVFMTLLLLYRLFDFWRFLFPSSPNRGYWGSRDSELVLEVCSSSAAATPGIQLFSGKSPCPSNLLDVISPLVFSFVGVVWSSCVRLKPMWVWSDHAVCDSSRFSFYFAIFFSFRVSFRGWVEGLVSWGHPKRIQNGIGMEIRCWNRSRRGRDALHRASFVLFVCLFVWAHSFRLLHSCPVLLRQMF